MTKRITAFIMTLILITGCFAGCGKKTTENQNFLYPIESDPECLDPQIADNQSAKIIINNCFEGLTRIGGDGSVIPGAAKSWSVSSDGLEYTFYLRRGMNWYVGRDVLKQLNKPELNPPSVTAKDFAFGIKRALLPETKAPDAGLLYAIKNAQKVHRGAADPNSLGISVIDDYTLKITLERRDDSFLRSLAQSVAMPCHEKFFEFASGKYGLDTEWILTNGPFYLSKWTPDSSVVIRSDKPSDSKERDDFDRQAKRRNHYTGEFPVMPASVTLTIKKNSEAFADKLNDGTYDAAPVPYEFAENISEKDVTTFVYPNITWGFYVNCADEVLKNQILRISLFQATDANKIQLPEGAEPANGFIPSSCRIDDKGYRDLADNVGRLGYSALTARQNWDRGLQESGLTTAKLTVLCSKEHEQTVRKLIQNWQSVLGISLVAKLDAVEPSELLSVADRGEYSVALLPVKAENASPVQFLNQFTNGGGYTHYNSPAFNNAVAKLQTTGSANELAAGCRAAEEHLIKNGVLFQLFSQNSYYGVRKDVTGIYYHPAAENICFIGAEKEAD